MHRTIIIRERKDDSGFGRITVTVNIDGAVSSLGTNDRAVAIDTLRKALAGEYDRCMAENERPRLEEEIGNE